MSTDPHDRVTARIQHVTLIMYREKFTATETQNKSAQATSIAGRLGSHHVEVCSNKRACRSSILLQTTLLGLADQQKWIPVFLSEKDWSCRQTYLPKTATPS